MRSMIGAAGARVLAPLAALVPGLIDYEQIGADYARALTHSFTVTHERMGAGIYEGSPHFKVGLYQYSTPYRAELASDHNLRSMLNGN